MASKPELLHNQAADEIWQDFLLAYQRAVLLALQRQGFLNEDISVITSSVSRIGSCKASMPTRASPAHLP